MSMATIGQYREVIGIKANRPKYKKLVDCIKQLVPALQADNISEIGIQVTFDNDGINYYMQMALAPIKTVDTADMDYVLLLDKDLASMKKWIDEKDRQLIVTLGNGLVLTKRKNIP